MLQTKDVATRTAAGVLFTCAAAMASGKVSGLWLAKRSLRRQLAALQERLAPPETGTAD